METEDEAGCEPISKSEVSVAVKKRTKRKRSDHNVYDGKVFLTCRLALEASQALNKLIHANLQLVQKVLTPRLQQYHH